MKALYLSAALLSLVVIAPAQAAATCQAHPKAEWLKPDAFQQSLKGQGYRIKTFKVSGECYELYGYDKTGKKVEIYFDTVSGKPVKTLSK